MLAVLLTAVCLLCCCQQYVFCFIDNTVVVSDCAAAAIFGCADLVFTMMLVGLALEIMLVYFCGGVVLL